ncbi:unnamed protein product, partial [Sphacelaria rigidula]
TVTTQQVDATLEMPHEAFALLCAGKLKPNAAFMSGRLKVTGDMFLVMKVAPSL